MYLLYLIEALGQSSGELVHCEGGVSVPTVFFIRLFFSSFI